MDRIIIFGVNMFSSVVYQTMMKEGKGEVIGFTLNKQYIECDNFEGLPVIPYEELHQDSIWHRLRLRLLLDTLI